MEILHQAFWSIVPSLIVGIVLAIWGNRQKKNEALRDEGELVKVSLLVASASLSYAVAMAIKRGTPNGEVEEGIEKYKDAMDKFRSYERKMIAKGV